MRTYDTTHQSLNELEKELLFREVMRLRYLIIEAETLLDKCERNAEFKDGLKLKIQTFLKES